MHVDTGSWPDHCHSTVQGPVSDMAPSSSGSDLPALNGRCIVPTPRCGDERGRPHQRAIQTCRVAAGVSAKGNRGRQGRCTHILAGKTAVCSALLHRGGGPDRTLPGMLPCRCLHHCTETTRVLDGEDLHPSAHFRCTLDVGIQNSRRPEEQLIDFGLSASSPISGRDRSQCT